MSIFNIALEFSGESPTPGLTIPQHLQRGGSIKFVAGVVKEAVDEIKFLVRLVDAPNLFNESTSLMPSLRRISDINGGWCFWGAGILSATYAFYDSPSCSKRYGYDSPSQSSEIFRDDLEKLNPAKTREVTDWRAIEEGFLKELQNMVRMEIGKSTGMNFVVSSDQYSLPALTLFDERGSIIDTIIFPNLPDIEPGKPIKGNKLGKKEDTNYSIKSEYGKYYIFEQQPDGSKKQLFVG